MSRKPNNKGASPTAEQETPHPFLLEVRAEMEKAGLPLETLETETLKRPFSNGRKTTPGNTAPIARKFGELHARALKITADSNSTKEDKDFASAMTRFWEFLSKKLQLPSQPDVRLLEDRFCAACGFGGEGESLLDPTPFRFYLESFANEHDAFDFSEFSVDQAVIATRQRDQLSAIYVDLNTTSTEPKLDEDGKPELDDHGQPVRVPLPVAKAAESHRHLVILGDPGAGKSSFTKQWAVRAARANPPSQIPVFVELRDFAARFPSTEHEPSAQLLWRYIEAKLTEAKFSAVLPALEKALSESHGLIILDGLDEVKTDASREFVCGVVAAFAGSGSGKSRIIVTCRTYSYRNQQWSLPRTTGTEGFQVVELAPLDRPRIEGYLAKLYGRLGDQAKAREKAPSLLANLQHHNLEQRAGNPLELFNMALLHWHYKLPDNQAELYQELVALRLFQLHEKHYARLGQKLPLLELLEDANCKQQDFLDRLCLLSLQIHTPERNSKSEACADISALELRGALEPLHPVREKQADWAFRVTESFRLHGGLIREEGRTSDNTSIFRFPHRNYQEFLASRALARQSGATDRAATLFLENSYWRQVVRWVPLVQSFLRDNWDAAVALVNRLCQPPVAGQTPLRPEAHWEAIALAADMVEDLGLHSIRLQSLGPECLGNVRDAIIGFVKEGALDAKTRAKLGRLLAELGDTRPGVTKLPSSATDAGFWTEVIPAGEFIMGGKEDWQGGREFKYEIKAPYRISRYPITVAQYQAFVDAGGYGDPTKPKPDWWTNAGWKRRKTISEPENDDPVFQPLNHPRVGVSWFEAAAFCNWLTGQLRVEGQLQPDQSIRLPSEAEWERAARGTDGRKYPWGNDEPTSDHCNWSKSGIRHTSAVGLFPKDHAACGAADMAGNVWEWCLTPWLSDYKNYEKKVSDELEGEHARVLRGGSWLSGTPEGLSCAYRGRDPPGDRDGGVGFRVVCVGDSAR